METRSWDRKKTGEGYLRWALAAAIALPLCVTSSITLDMLRWRDSVEAARAIATDKSRSLKERTDATVVLQRGILESLRAVQEIASGDDEAAANARAALANISKTLR